MKKFLRIAGWALFAVWLFITEYRFFDIYKHVEGIYKQFVDQVE